MSTMTSFTKGCLKMTGRKPVQLLASALVAVGLEDYVLRPLLRGKRHKKRHHGKKQYNKYRHDKRPEQREETYRLTNEYGDVMWEGTEKELEEKIQQLSLLTEEQKEEGEVREGA